MHARACVRACACMRVCVHACMPACVREGLSYLESSSTAYCFCFADVSLVLEALIFSELNCNNVTRIISGMKCSYLS